MSTIRRSSFTTAAALFCFSLLLFSCLSSLRAEANERFDRLCKGRQLQVLSDVDDTIKASGTNFVAGIDTRWPGGSLYAGLGYFYLELSRGPTETLQPLSPGIVSARPKQLAGAFPDFEAELFRAAKKTQGISESFGLIKTILPGEVDDNLHIHSEKRYREYAATKLRNVKEFAVANPDKCIIFMGDNGQGDQLAGKLMLEQIPEQVVAIFIHNVTDSPPLKVEETPYIYLFTTYVDAASIAFEKGFLAKGSVRRVLEGALESDQYNLCRACYPRDEDETQSVAQSIECLLAEVKPSFSENGGGCFLLFDALKRTAAEISFTTLRLPRPLQRAVDTVVDNVQKSAEQQGVSIVAWVFGKLFWWSMIGALAVVILALANRHASVSASVDHPKQS